MSKVVVLAVSSHVYTIANENGNRTNDYYFVTKSSKSRIERLINSGNYRVKVRKNPYHTNIIPLYTIYISRFD